MEHLGSVVKAGVEALLLVGNRHEVVSLSYDVVHEARVRVSNSAVDEITEVSSVLVVSFVNKLHLHNDIQEKLDFSVVGNLSSANVGAVEHLLDVSTSFLKTRRLARKLKSLREIRNVVRKGKDNIA